MAHFSKIVDYTTGDELDITPNDTVLLGGITNWSRRRRLGPLVYAQWDYDGSFVDPNTGRTVYFEAGEWKRNANGDFFVETLGGRSLANRTLVMNQDLISSPGTWVHENLDIFHTAGQKTSRIKSIANLATRIAPFFFGRIR